MNAKRLKPFFRYLGSKHRIIHTYPKPKYDMIIEPFAGGATYAIRYYTHNVILYEIDFRIYSVWDYLIKSKSKDILGLPLLFDDVRELKICQEAKWLIGLWISTNGAHPKNIRSTNMKNNVNSGGYWYAKTRYNLSKQSQLIKHWKIYNASYENIPTTRYQNAAYFIDPPYHKSGKSYTHSKIDYNLLGDWCKNLEGQIIVCEQEGAKWLDFRPHINAVTTGKHNSGHDKCHEVVWTKNCSMFD